ncbi:tyrosine-type recombinase/integrase [Streptomyces erythrochromogenes]|uniref:tyrosine-type recombinase/integrase n=1 Tax=Streptomyces erythrochromogenes TaxID=285574 RepID=UPI0037D1F394
MAGYIEDRWLNKRPNKDTGEREKTKYYGQGMRYKVAGIPNVKGRSFPDGKLTQAKAWLAKAQHETSTGEFIDPRRGDLLLKDYIEDHWWPGRTDEPSTRDPMKSRIWGHIIPLLGDKRLRDIDAAALRIFRADLLSRVDGSAHVIWVHLNTILKAAVDDLRIARNPCEASTVSAPRKPKSKAVAWNRQRVAAVREHLQPRYQLALDLGVGAGLRQGEAFGLGLEDIDFAAGVIHVQRQLRWTAAGQPYYRLPKGDKPRAVPVPPGLLQRIQQAAEAYPPLLCELPWRNPEEPETELEARQRRPVTANLLLSTTQRKRIYYRTWNDLTWKRALAKAGVISIIEYKQEKERQGRRRLSPVYEESRKDMFHVCRHTYASVQLEAGESVVTLSKWLGHASPNITMEHYAHFMPEAGARGLQAMASWFEAEPQPALPGYSLGLRDDAFKLLPSQVRAAAVGTSDMKVKYKETARGGLAVNVIEC